MKSISLAALFLCSISTQAQNEKTDVGSVEFYVGLKERVTPIYLKQLPFSVWLGNIDVLEQPDMHLSGPGLDLSARIILKNGWALNFSQTIRYDLIYQRMSLTPAEPSGFTDPIKRKIILDAYLDLAKELPSVKISHFSVYAGVSICGLNSDYDETLRIYWSQTAYTDFVSKKDFIFPALYFGLGWQRKRIYADIKFGYCWNNPTLWQTPFIFPELSCRYKLFTIFKKKT